MQLLVVFCAVTLVRPQTKQSDYHLVLFLCEFVHRTIACFPQDAFNDRLFELGRDVWSTESFDHGGQWIHQVVHEVFDAACAAAEMPLQTWPHHSPTRSRAITDRNVRI